MERRNCPWCAAGHTGPELLGPKKCVFCAFDDKEMILYQDRLFLVLLSKAPLNDYHAILIPRKHYTDTSEIPDVVLARMWVLAKRVAQAIKAASSAEGISFAHDDGITRTMEHYTLHIFPRHKKDSICGHFVRKEDPGRAVRRQLADRVRSHL